MRDALGAAQSVLVLGGGSEIAQAIVDRLVAGAVPHGRARRPRARRRRGRRSPGCAPRGDHGRGRGLRRPRPGRRTQAVIGEVFEATATSTWSSWPSACSATRQTSTPTPRPRPTRPAPTTSAPSRPRWSSPTGSGAQGHGTLLVLSSVAGDARPGRQLRLRLDQGRARRLRPGPRRRAGRHRRSGRGRPPRVRAHQDDRGHGAGAVLHHPRGGRRRRRGRSRQGPRGRSGPRPSCAWCSSVLRHLPRPVWRRVSAR